MIISILEDTKTSVSLTAQSVSVLVQNNHTVLIEGDPALRQLKEYLSVGAYVLNSREQLLDRGGLLIKKAPPEIADVDYLNGEDKIFFTRVDGKDRRFVDTILSHRISLIDYAGLPAFKKRSIRVQSRLAFSNSVLPFLVELAGAGLRALVDEEELRGALMVMHGKVYNTALAKRHGVPCYEF
jgi:alanine dehydrogenase